MENLKNVEKRDFYVSINGIFGKWFENAASTQRWSRVAQKISLSWHIVSMGCLWTHSLRT